MSYRDTGKSNGSDYLGFRVDLWKKWKLSLYWGYIGDTYTYMYIYIYGISKKGIGNHYFIGMIEGLGFRAGTRGLSVQGIGFSF